MREVAGQAYYSVKGLRGAGYDATLILWDESAAKYPYDYCMKMEQNKKYMYPIYGMRVFGNFLRCALKYDTFHFHFGHSLLPLNLDLPFLKILRRNIFFEFHGSDIRQKSIALEQNKYWEYFDLTREDMLRRRAEKLKSYARAFIIHDAELLPYIPQGVETFIVPLRVDLQRFDYKYPEENNDGTVTIVHAPSDRGVKGTEFVCKAIDSLSDKYDLRFVLVEGKTQEEALNEYINADIIVDQLLCGTYGVFAIEGMAMGKPVITYITDEMKKQFPEELPIASANPDTIEQRLEELIVNAKLRKELGEKGREYAFKYHDCDKIGKMLGMIYEGKVDPQGGKEAFYAAGNPDA